MRPLFFQVWNGINASVSDENRTRAKELFLFLYAAECEVRENNQLRVTTELEVVQSVQELSQLVIEKAQYIICFYQTLIAQYKFNHEEKIFEKNTMSLETSVEILTLIERYQTASDPWQWTNFGGQVYIESYFSQKIELLYQIGIAANILDSRETFNCYTRVTKDTQENCNKVYDWIEKNLGLTVEYINVYEPLIEEYKNFSFKRPNILKEIGVRSGLLSKKVLNKEYQISVAEAQLVIDWLHSNYSIELPFSEEELLKPFDNLAINYKQLSVKTAFVAMPVILFLAISIQAYKDFHRQLPLSSYEVLPERNLIIKKTLPVIKPAR